MINSVKNSNNVTDKSVANIVKKCTPGEVCYLKTFDCISHSSNTIVDSPSMGTCKEYYTKISYRKHVNPGQVKSLLVRPLKHSLAVFKNNAGAGRSKVKTGNQTIRV